MFERELEVFVRDYRNRGICAHTACIRSLVTLVCTLVILRKCHRIDLSAVYEAHERELRSGKELLDHNLALSELVVEKHVLESLLRLLKSLRNHHALAGCESVILENDRE